MTQIVNLRSTDDPRDAVHRACHRLAEGELVAIPTETVYVIAASPLSAQGMERLVALQPHGRRSLLLKSCFELWDYVDPMPRVADKLSRRAWPGPLTVALPRKSISGMFTDLGESARRGLLAADQTVSFRVCADPCLYDVLRLCPAPLVGSAERSGQSPLLRSAAEVASHFGDAVSLILDDGPARYGEPSTVVRVESDDWHVAEPGVVSDCTLQRLCSEVYLFVCTGNTCRSPMAEAMFRRFLAQQLKCPDEELMDRGFNVLSAGLSAGLGSPAAREAVSAVAADGIDLRNHESQPLTERLLLHADHVVTMTRGHRQLILNEYPDLANRVSLLSSDDDDISDPYGGGPREYAACKESIAQYLKAMVTNLVPSKS